jgi:hypothetical protein
MAAEITALLEKQGIDKDRKSFSSEPLSLAPSSYVTKPGPPKISAGDKIVKCYLCENEPLFKDLNHLREKISISLTQLLPVLIPFAGLAES